MWKKVRTLRKKNDIYVFIFLSLVETSFHNIQFVKMHNIKTISLDLLMTNI